jgi:hypothetical protein
MKFRYLLAGIIGTLALDIMASNIGDSHNDKRLSKPSLEDCLTYCDQISNAGQCLKFNRALGGLCNDYLQTERLTFIEQ